MWYTALITNIDTIFLWIGIVFALIGLAVTLISSMDMNRTSGSSLLVIMFFLGSIAAHMILG